MSSVEIWTIGAVRTKPAPRFNLHPRPQLAALQSTLFGQGFFSQRAAFLTQRAPRKSRGVLIVLRGPPWLWGCICSLRNPILTPYPRRLYQPQLWVTPEVLVHFPGLHPVGLSAENWASSWGCAHIHTCVCTCVYSHTHTHTQLLDYGAVPGSGPGRKTQVHEQVPGEQRWGWTGSCSPALVSTPTPEPALPILAQVLPLILNRSLLLSFQEVWLGT